MNRVQFHKKLHYYQDGMKLPRISNFSLENALKAFAFSITATLEIIVSRGLRTKVIKFDYLIEYTLQHHLQFSNMYKYSPCPLNDWKIELKKWANKEFEKVREHHKHWTLVSKDCPCIAELGEMRHILCPVKGGKCFASETWLDKTNTLVGFGTAIEVPFTKGEFMVQKFDIGGGRIQKIVVA